jgi:hypothetical protein
MSTAAQVIADAHPVDVMLRPHRQVIPILSAVMGDRDFLPIADSRLDHASLYALRTGRVTGALK